MTELSSDSKRLNENIAFRIIGGLGNQLFQYAAALAVARESNSRVALDISSYRTYKGNEGFLLGELVQASDTPGSQPELRVGELSRPFTEAIRYGSRWPWLLGKILRRQIVSEGRPFQFHRFEIDSSQPYLFVGFWQSWRYFESELERVKKALHHWLDLETTKTKLRQSLGIDHHRDLVMIHVRRGDYLLHEDVYSYLSKAYYSNALAQLQGVARKPVYLVFSDEPNRVLEESLFDQEVIFFDDKGMSSKDVLSNMAACDYFVTANSTFSWWAAFVGSSLQDRGRVIAPAQWLKSGESIRDLIFDNWIQVSPSGQVMP